MAILLAYTEIITKEGDNRKKKKKENKRKISLTLLYSSTRRICTSPAYSYIFLYLF